MMKKSKARENKEANKKDFLRELPDDTHRLVQSFLSKEDRAKLKRTYKKGNPTEIFPSMNDIEMLFKDRKKLSGNCERLKNLRRAPEGQILKWCTTPVASDFSVAIFCYLTHKPVEEALTLDQIKNNLSDKDMEKLQQVVALNAGEEEKIENELPNYYHLILRNTDYRKAIEERDFEKFDRLAPQYTVLNLCGLNLGDGSQSYLLDTGLDTAFTGLIYFEGAVEGKRTYHEDKWSQKDFTSIIGYSLGPLSPPTSEDDEEDVDNIPQPPRA